jgi:hypothetical protein
MIGAEPVVQLIVEIQKAIEEAGDHRSSAWEKKVSKKKCIFLMDTVGLMKTVILE